MVQQSKNKARDRLTVRWGIIAPGRIAHRFAAAFEIIDSGILQGVASRNRERLAEFANTYSIPTRYDDYQSLLDDQEIDAVYIATPHSFHYDIAKQAILAGKAVLCEKPLTVNAAQSADLFQLAEQHNVFLMEAMWSRFLPAWQQVQRWLTDGNIGEVQTMHSTFGFDFKAHTDEKDRLFNLELAGGSLLDTGVYNIALTGYIMDSSPDKIEAKVIKGATGVDEECQVTLSYGETTSHFTCSLLRKLPNQFEIVGSKGRIIVSDNFWEAQLATLIPHGSEEVSCSQPFAKNGFEYQIEEVHQCLSGNRITSANVSPDVTLRTMRVMDHILEKAGITFPFL